MAVGLLAWSLPSAAGSSPAGPTARPGPQAPAFPTPLQHVVVLFLENAAVATVFAQGPYERYLAEHYAQAGQFYAVMHYSLPNYLAATSGIAQNQFAPVAVPNVGTLATAAGESWQAYMESMPLPCDPTNGTLYDREHDPFVMYTHVTDPASYCAQHVGTFTNWSEDLAVGALPNYSFIVPNLLDDGHNTNVSFADAWLRGFLTPLLNSSLFADTAVFVTYDESAVSDLAGKNGTVGGGAVYLAAISPYSRVGYDSAVSYNTFDVLTTTEWLLGLGHTGQNDSWNQSPPMTDLFAFSTPTSRPVPAHHAHWGLWAGSIDLLLRDPW